MRESHAKCVRLGRSDNAGLFKGIWSDMAIETTFMRYGHGQSGIIGITLRPETLKTWAYSLHACNTVVSNMDQTRTQEQHVPASQTHHKEEAKARVISDTKDRKALRDKLEVCIDLLHPEENKQGLVNIVTGQVLTHPSLNIDNATELRTKQVEEFEQTWPASFRETLHKCVTTIDCCQKCVCLQGSAPYPDGGLQHPPNPQLEKVGSHLPPPPPFLTFLDLPLLPEDHK